MTDNRQGVTQLKMEKERVFLKWNEPIDSVK